MAGALRQALERTARMSEPPDHHLRRSDRRRCARPGPGGPRRSAAHHLRRRRAWPGRSTASWRPQVVVVRAEEAPPEFDARRSATGRAYRYLVWNAPAPDPLARRRRLERAGPARPGLHAHGVRRPAGQHDFRSFCRRRPGSDGSEPIVRRVTRAQWSVDDSPEVRDARGGAGRVASSASTSPPDSFCHQMVRSLVGALVEVGRGKAEHGRPDGSPPGGLAPPHARPGPAAGPVPGLGLLRSDASSGRGLHAQLRTAKMSRPPPGPICDGSRFPSSSGRRNEYAVLGQHVSAAEARLVEVALRPRCCTRVGSRGVAAPPTPARPPRARTAPPLPRRFSTPCGTRPRGLIEGCRWTDARRRRRGPVIPVEDMVPWAQRPR